MGFYDGTKVLSIKDINGNQPEIVIVTTNRSAGKTTWFNRWFVKRFLNYKEKFCLLYRFNYELDGVADTFFKEIGSLFFEGYTMDYRKQSRGAYCDLYLRYKDNDPAACGYAVALNSADILKRRSHMLSDTRRMLLDEFQSETNKYCPNEIMKFQSIHKSIARGGGKQNRFVPVYMLGNNVSALNPYYTAFGISSMLNKNTRFLRGNGIVVEQGFNESAFNAQNDSIFNNAFKNSDYQNYSNKGLYLNDNSAFVEKPKGKSEYIVTLKYNNKEYALREYYEDGVIFCDENVDSTFLNKISVTTDDHDINYIMLNRYSNLLSMLRFYFEKGCFRFKNLACKEAVLSALAYK